MTRTVINILGLIVCATVKAQSITPSENSYPVNDVLQTKQVYADGVDLQTDGEVWSLETSVLSEKLYGTVYAMKGDSLMKLERGSRTYYHQSGNHGVGSTDHF
jgi:hypothetical protein